jgi:Zinc finger, C3HC4 type (RING finger)
LEQIFDGVEKFEEITQENWKVVPCKVSDSYTCEVCFDILNPGEVEKFPCNHRICLDCLRDYITTMIRDEGGMIHSAIKCPGHDCAFDLEDNMILGMITDQDIKRRYQWIIANSFVKVSLFIFRLFVWVCLKFCSHFVALSRIEMVSSRKLSECHQTRRRTDCFET